MKREFGQGTWRERAKLYDDQCRRSVAAAIATKEAATAYKNPTISTEIS